MGQVQGQQVVHFHVTRLVVVTERACELCVELGLSLLGWRLSTGFTTAHSPNLLTTEMTFTGRLLVSSEIFSTPLGECGCWS